MNRGYTLAEILVVAGVLAVLGSLLLGAVGLVRSAAGRVACLSNLRQVGMLVSSYADERGGRLPAEGNKGITVPDESPAWFHRLPPLVEKEDVRGRHTVFQCPCYHWEDTGVFDHSSPKSYKMNGYLDEDGRSMCYRLGNCPDEAEIVLFADSVAGDTGMGQWGHLCASGIDEDRHHGRVNVLFLDGHGLSTARREGDETWRECLKWKSWKWRKAMVGGR